MAEVRYEIVEKTGETPDKVLSSLVRNPAESVAYLCLMTRGPMTASEMLKSLGYHSDTWFTDKFNDAVHLLADRGLIRRTADD